MTCTLCKNLPYDVVVEIFSRLEVKTLMKLRCVCKYWYSIISHPYFIIKHLNSASSYNTDAILQCYLKYLNMSFRRKQVWCLIYNQNTNVHIELEIPFKSRYMGFSLVGVLNGLACLSYVMDFGRTIYLWNPSVRKSKTLPCFSTTLTPQLSLSQNVVVLGFGFRIIIPSQTIDYKIVRIVYCRDVNWEHNVNSPPQVEVYSLSTDSWRKIETLVPCFTSYRGSNAFMNGSVHWVASRSEADWDEQEYWDMIMSFDIGDEVFGEMKLPDYFFNGVELVDLKLGVLKESLTLCVCFEASGHCDIWVMREYGVVESWTKQFTVSLHGEIRRPLGFTTKNKLLLEMKNIRLVSYDVESLQIKDFGFYEPESTSNIFPFMETLVLL